MEADADAEFVDLDETFVGGEWTSCPEGLDIEAPGERADRAVAVEGAQGESVAVGSDDVERGKMRSFHAPHGVTRRREGNPRSRRSRIVRHTGRTVGNSL